MNFIKSRSGAHIIRTSMESGMAIRGEYDLHPDAQGLDLARESGIPVYAGHFDQLDELFRICEADPENDFSIFLPSRDRRFIAFVQRVVLPPSLKLEPELSLTYRLYRNAEPSSFGIIGGPVIAC